MTVIEFNRLTEKILNKVKNILIKKGQEYNFEETDRLDCFKKAAALQGVNTSQGLYGMMVKHIISLADFVKEGKIRSLEKWEEKIIDNIAYLILLRATISDDELIEENPHE